MALGAEAGCETAASCSERARAPGTVPEGQGRGERASGLLLMGTAGFPWLEPRQGFRGPKKPL